MLVAAIGPHSISRTIHTKRRDFLVRPLSHKMNSVGPIALFVVFLSFSGMFQKIRTLSSLHTILGLPQVSSISCYYCYGCSSTSSATAVSGYTACVVSSHLRELSFFSIYIHFLLPVESKFFMFVGIQFWWFCDEYIDVRNVRTNDKQSIVLLDRHVLLHELL